MEKEELERQVKLYKEAWLETAKNYLYVMEKLNEAEERIYELTLENDKKIRDLEHKIKNLENYNHIWEE